MALTLATRSRLNAVLYTRESPRGTPYAVGLATANDGREHTVLAAGEDLDLDHFRLLEGQDLALRMTENGPRVRPIAEQPPEVQEHLMAMLERGEGQVAPPARIPHIKSPPPEAELPEPLPHAPHCQHGTALPKLAELATTVAQQAAELGLPTAMWVHHPVDA